MERACALAYRKASRPGGLYYPGKFGAETGQDAQGARGVRHFRAGVRRLPHLGCDDTHADTLVDAGLLSPYDRPS